MKFRALVLRSCTISSFHFVWYKLLIRINFTIFSKFFNKILDSIYHGSLLNPEIFILTVSILISLSLAYCRSFNLFSAYRVKPEIQSRQLWENERSCLMYFIIILHLGHTSQQKILIEMLCWSKIFISFLWIFHHKIDKKTTNC
jgi:hypothetical protein